MSVSLAKDAPSPSPTDVVRAGVWLGNHPPVAPTASGELPIVGVVADDAIVEALGARQAAVLAGSPIAAAAEPAAFDRLAVEEGTAWEAAGRPNGDKIRALYLIYKENGSVEIGIGPSKWERVLAARIVLGVKSIASRALSTLLRAMSKVSVNLGDGTQARLPAPQVTSAILSVNMVPVLETEQGPMAVMTIRSKNLGDMPLAVAMIGGGVDPVDVVGGRWDPLTTMARERREEMGDSIDAFIVKGASFGVQSDGQMPVTVVASVEGTPYADLLNGHFDSQDGKFEHLGMFRYPATLDGITAALCAPAAGHDPRKGGEYAEYAWTSWAVAGAHQVAAAYLTIEERKVLKDRTATRESMQSAWMALDSGLTKMITDQLPNSALVQESSMVQV